MEEGARGGKEWRGGREESRARKAAILVNKRFRKLITDHYQVKC